MDVKQIQSLIKFISKSGVFRVKLKNQDFELTVETKPPVKTEVAKATTVQEVSPIAENTTTQAPKTPEIEAPNSVEKETTGVEIKSPMIGTFYRKSTPDKMPFVQVGDIISKGDTLCVIEAMKLFNEIESELSGKIISILVDDASPVEYDQPLFIIEPSS